MESPLFDSLREKYPTITCPEKFISSNMSAGADEIVNEERALIDLLTHGRKTNWKLAPDGKILKSDVSIAKNYLNEQHIKELNRIVSAYLDLAESRAERQIPTTMQDWITFLHQFLDLSSFPILKNKGTVSALQAKLKAEQEYDKYRMIQDINYESDFDKEIKRLKGE
jgi:hypothetical protein